MRLCSDDEAFRYIYALIAERPYARYILQSVLRSEFGFTLTNVEDFLASFLLPYKHELPCPEYPRALHYYYTAHVSQKKLDRFFRGIAVKNMIFNISLGKIGEKYVRHLFIKAGFKGVPHPKKLGIRLINGIRPDLLFQARMLNGESLRLLVEVKNRRDVWHLCGRKDIFRKLIRNARKLGAQPVLVVAHLDDLAIKFCKENGIAVLHLKCQIVSNEVLKKSLDGICENVLGSDEYIRVNSKRPFQHDVPLRSEEHLAVVRDPDFILGPHKIWKERSRTVS